MKNAIIVGATSGIGLEVARIMRSEGVNIGVAGRREDRLRKFAEEGGNVVWQRIDVTDENAGGLLVDLAERMGGVDTILLVSGIGSQNRDLDPGIEIATAETNVVGFTRMIDAAFNYLKSHGGGHIGAVSSIAGTKGLRTAAPNSLMISTAIMETSAFSFFAFSRFVTVLFLTPRAAIPSSPP